MNHNKNNQNQSEDLENQKNNKPKLIKLKDPNIKFLSFEAAQLAKIKSDEKKQVEFLNSEHQENSAAIRGLEKGFHNKRIDDDKNQIASWKKNMQIKREFEEGLHNELYKQANFFKNVVFESMQNAELENRNQIENFEKNLSRLGLDTSNTDQKLKKSNKATIASEIVLQKIREKIEANTKAKKERDRRKRKIQIEQKKAQEEIEKMATMLSRENEANKNEPLQVENINEIKKKEFSDWKKLHNIGAEEEAQRKIELEFYERENNKNYTQIFDDYYLKLQKTTSTKFFDKNIFIENLWREDLGLKQQEMKKKLEKREKNRPPIRKILDDIFYIVDEVEKVQKELNSDFLERDNWKELMRNFTNNSLQQKVKRKNTSANYNFSKSSGEVDINKTQTIISSSAAHENLMASQNIIEGLFEECETFDYLSFIGEYETKMVIPNEMLNKMLDIFEILGPDLLLEMANNNRKNSKIITSHKDYEPTDEDIQNLTIPKKNGKNYFLTDIINILVDIKSTSNGFNEKTQNLNNFLGLNNNTSTQNLPMCTGTNVNISNQQTFKANDISRKKSTTKTLIVSNNNINSGNTNNNLSIMNNNNNITNNMNNNTNTNNLINETNNLVNLSNNHGQNITNSQYNNMVNNTNTINTEGSVNNMNMNNNIEDTIHTNTKINSSNYNLNNTSNQHISQIPTINYSKIINDIPLKILFLGKKFSGRKTQIKLLSENFGLKFYNVEDILDKNLKLFSKLEIPLENTEAFKNMKKAEADKALLERETEEKNFEPLRPFIANIKKFKDDNCEVPNNYIFDLIFEIIKIDFPERNQANYIEEINIRLKKRKELQEELNKIKDEKLVPTKDAKAPPAKGEGYYQAELLKLSKEANKGFILMDFPYNLSQAKFLEIKINNYVRENEKPKSFIQNLKQNYNLILDSISKPKIGKNLAQGVFDFIFMMEISNDESIRRAKNRKIDPQTNIIYHMEDNPPPLEDKKISDRLIPCDSNMNYNELFDSNDHYEKELLELEDFYSAFGHQKINLNSLRKFNIANILNEKKLEPKEIINQNFQEISNILMQKIKLNDEKEEEFYLWATTSKENNTNTGRDKESLKESFNNTMNSQMNYDNKSKNQDGVTGSIAAGIIPSRKESVKSKINTDNFNTKDFGRTNEKLTNNNTGKSNLGNIEGSRIITENENMELEKSTNTIALKTGQIKTMNNIQNLDEDDFNKYHKKLEEAKKKIPPYLIDNIFGIWNRSYDNYVNGTRLFFLNLRKQKESIILRYNKTQENFIEFLRRPSKKSGDINSFHKKYNTFFDEFPNLITDKVVKEEFRRDVKDLADNIWDIIEIRKSEAIEERKRIMEVGFIKKEIDKFYINVEKLFILEVEKLYANINILREFYFAMDLKLNSIDTMKFNPIDILKDKEVISSPIILEESKYGKFEDPDFHKYPRLEKLFKNSFKLLVKYDEILKNIDKISKSNAINNNSSESSLRRISKVHFKRQHHESTFVDEKREIFIYDDEMKNSIKAEKNKFKFRITFIKFWAIKYFDNIRKISKMVYDKLDDWIISTIKAENDAMNNIKKVYESCIDKGMKLRNDFEMDSFDFYKAKDINEFIDITVNLDIFFLFLFFC